MKVYGGKEMSIFYTIGEVEKITGISKDRLRNYDKREILKPIQEEHNQYRQYREQDIIEILGVELFRGMDLGLKEIKAIREQGSIDYLQVILQNKKKKGSKGTGRFTEYLETFE